MNNKFGYPTDSAWKQNYVNTFLFEHPDLRADFVSFPLDTQYIMAMNYQKHVGLYSNTLLDDEDEELTPHVNKSSSSGSSGSSYGYYNDPSADLYDDFGTFSPDSFDSFGGDGGLSGGGGADGSW